MVKLVFQPLKNLVEYKRLFVAKYFNNAVTDSSYRKNALVRKLIF